MKNTMTTTPKGSGYNSGSYWHRWDPHIHAPGTLWNNQFRGPDPWEEYLTKLEQARPVIKAIGATDYYILDSYERMCEQKAKGRLPDCELIFPNIEMRLNTATSRGRPVNLHLLVCPDDPAHVEELRRFLGRLVFSAHGDTFSCTDADLGRLGKATDASLVDKAALAKGAEQFKVDLDNLRTAYNGSDWAKANVLIAVAGGETDGTSGVRDGAWETVRKEIEKFAHVVFASSPAQRDFWTGGGKASEKELRERYGGPKPCMHGSDAHDQCKVGLPDGDRYSWLKGRVAFDTLRQACIDPKGRASIGPQPPLSATPSLTIASLDITGADWAKSPHIEFNPGLVAIIGARGSGKSALAEMTALGCDAVPEHQSEEAFLCRAAELLTGVSARLKWHTGEQIERRPDQQRSHTPDQYARARYLSQKFVEQLCAADRVTDGLLNEIHRVIFDAHPISDRDGASSFVELLDLRVSVLRESRLREEAALADLSERIGTDLEKQRLAPSLRSAIVEKERIIAGYKADRAKLVSKGSEERVARLDALTQAAETARSYLRYFAHQRQSLLSLQEEVRDHRTRKAPDMLRQTQVRYHASGLKDDEWSRFLLEYKGDVDAALSAYLEKTRSDAEVWKGKPPPTQADPNVAFIAAGAKLDSQSLAMLEAEIGRLQQLVNIDRDTASKYAALSRNITDATTALERLKETLTDCNGAPGRIAAARQEREAAYIRVFESLAAEQDVLISLYAPLRSRLASGTGALSKLSFTVKRKVDVDRWATRGEELLDLRAQGDFKGQGTLRELAEAELKSAWDAGDPSAIGKAMSEFVDKHSRELAGARAVPPSEQCNYREWLKRLAKWLFSTEHIALHYSVDYDGVDIRKLSPGSRGIVLLLLYLALDDADDRPLIIDQPEENLDPKSIYDELVGLFRAAKSKRQVVLVTHNANLVVNTDADQVIVAEAGAHAPGQLPPITYTSGGLESEAVRKAVCDILEGGEDAFRERARRLRVRLDR